MKPSELQNLKKSYTEASKAINLREDKTDSKLEQERTVLDWKKSEPINYINIVDFDIPKRLIRVTIKTNEYHALILFGEGGLGKTVLVVNEVKKILQPDDWIFVNGYSTPLSFYEVLYYARNKKLLILDDIEGIFGNPVATAILKGALWDSDGKRFVQYNSKSEKADNLPSLFEFKAKIIILCNNIHNSNDVSVNAMISRTVPYEVKLNYDQKLMVIEQLIRSRDDLSEKLKNDCISLIKEETNEATKNFNLRLLKKAIAFVKEEKSTARELFRATTEKDEDKEILLKLMESKLSVGEQVKRFCDKTGKSRRKFFRLKKDLKSCVKVSVKADMAFCTK